MSQPTLDDVALRVLQLEPEDREALSDARDQLTALAAAHRIAPAAQSLVTSAVRTLTVLARGAADDPAIALGRVGQLLQRAVLASEGGVRRLRTRRPGTV